MLFISNSLDLNFSFLLIRGYFPPDIVRMSSIWAFYLTLSGRKKRGSEHPSYAYCFVLLVPLAQNKPYVKVTYLGVAYSGALLVKLFLFLFNMKWPGQF